MEREQLIYQIASRLKDYRKGEIQEITPETVEQWVTQFEPAAQNVILTK